MKHFRAGTIAVLSIGLGWAMTGIPAQSQDQAGRPQNGRQDAGSRPDTRPQQRPAPQPGNRPQPGNGQRPQPGNRPQPGQGQRPQPGGRPQPSHGNRPGGYPGQSRPNYQFRSQDTGRLRQYYQGGFGRIDRRRRPRFSRGGYIPFSYRRYFQPVPYSLIGYLPPVPPGYAIGYYDGYVVVYDPGTYFVLSVLNLLQ